MCAKERKDELLKKAIPSDFMREFYRSIHRGFTDFELAAMLWNSRMGFPERLWAIKELFEITADNVLKKQIESRLKYEDERYRFLADNADGSCVYVVSYEDEEWPCGFFKKLDQAVKYAKKDGERRFSIDKQIIVEDEPPMQKVGEWNPNLFPEKRDEQREYCAYPVGGMDYTADGEMMECWSDSLPDEIRNLVDNWSRERFEKYPLILENPFEKGDIVTDGKDIGVIDITKREMEEGAERIKNSTCADYSDATSTLVQFIGKDYRIMHGHPSLLYLTKVEKEELPSKIQDYVSMVSYLIKGEYSLDFFLCEYERRVREKDVWGVGDI